MSLNPKYQSKYDFTKLLDLSHNIINRFGKVWGVNNSYYWTHYFFYRKMDQKAAILVFRPANHQKWKNRGKIFWLSLRVIFLTKKIPPHWYLPIGPSTPYLYNVTILVFHRIFFYGNILLLLFEEVDFRTTVELGKTFSDILQLEARILCYNIYKTAN